MHTARTFLGKKRVAVERLIPLQFTLRSIQKEQHTAEATHLLCSLALDEKRTKNSHHNHLRCLLMQMAVMKDDSDMQRHYAHFHEEA